MQLSRSHHSTSGYRIRLLASTVVALLLAVTAVKFYPVVDDASTDRPVYEGSESEAIRIEEIQPTRQSETAPPPPPPPIPVLVPDDATLDEGDLDFSDGLLPTEDTGEDATETEGSEGAAPTASAGPTIGPRTVRFVEPEYTREARRRRIRAELVIRVLVDEHGRVEESTIVERFLLDGDGTSRTPVEVLGYGLEEAALSAAGRWMFRPARKNGEPVAAHTELTFTFGLDT